MSQRNIFTNLRSPLATRDEHGVTDLLREVSQRSCCLTDDERREVSEIVERVEERQARGTPMGKIKKKLADNINSIHNIGKNHTDGGWNDNQSHRSSDTRASTLSNGPGAVNKWGKDLFEKFSKVQTIQSPVAVKAEDKNLDDQTNSKLDPKDIFRNFSIRGIQNPLKSPKSGGEERRPEATKAFGRSSQSGRDLLQNFSRNFQNSLSSPLPTHRTPPSDTKSPKNVVFPKRE